MNSKEPCKTANQLVLTACVVELQALRYTPAGLPALDMQLAHESQVLEAGDPRQVKALTRAVAVGVVAQRLAVLAIGSTWQFVGFVATPRNGKHLVFHIQDFQQA